MLALIRENKKATFESGPPKPAKTGASRGRSDADVLDGIGRGILADLDASIRESVDEQAASARASHRDGTTAEEEPPRSARNPDESLRETFGPDREKRVMFDSHISNPSAQDTHSKERSSSEEENKLEAFEGDGSSHLLSLKPAFLRSSSAVLALSAVLASSAVLVARVREHECEGGLPGVWSF